MSIVSETSDVEFEQRWTAWRARGLAHERLVERRLIISAILAMIATIALVVAYTMN